MDQINIGKFIALCRKEKGLTQAQLGEKLNISDRAVSKWVTGKCMPDSSNMLELCDILGIAVNELLSGERVGPEKLQQASEENLIALKKTEEAGQKKSRRFVFLLTLSLFVLVGLLTVYAGNAVVKQREREANLKALSGLYSTIGDSDLLTDESQKVIHLLTGSTWGTFVFSYQIEEKYDSIRLCCDTYQNGEKTEVKTLLNHRFVKSPESANIFSTDQFRVDILSGYPRHGYLFIDCDNKATACTDEYYVVQKIFQEDGTLLEDLGQNLTDIRVLGSYPERDYEWSYRYHLSTAIKASDGKILPEHVKAGEPVYLFLEGEDSRFGEDTESDAALHSKTAEDVLSDKETLKRFEVCNVFYYIFE